jgi:hypothetical protein
MNDRLKFTQFEGHPSLTTPIDLYYAQTRLNGRVAGDIYEARELDVLYVDKTQGRQRMRVAVNVERIGQEEDFEVQNDLARLAVGVLSGMSSFAEKNGRQDLRLSSVHMDGVRRTGRYDTELDTPRSIETYGMRAEVNRLLSRQEKIADAATKAMRYTAHTLHFYHEENVHTAVEDHAHVQLHADLSEKSILRTEERNIQFSPPERRHLFSSEDVKSSVAQLICLNGLISIARSE